MPANGNRMNKVDEEIKKEIGSIISTELKNPHLTGLISVTKVKTTPELVFEFDESIEYGAKIDEILKDITKDLKKDEN